MDSHTLNRNEFIFTSTLLFWGLMGIGEMHTSVFILCKCYFCRKTRSRKLTTEGTSGCPRPFEPSKTGKFNKCNLLVVS